MASEHPRRIRVRSFRERLPKASEALAHELLQGIVEQNLNPGDRLPLESEMVERYGVARSTVREALRILEISGLIEIRSGRNGGPVVGRVTPAYFGRMVSLFLHAEHVTLGEILQARRLLEPLFLRAATMRRDPVFLEQVADLKRRNLAADSTRNDEYLPITREFHELIAGASSNRPLELFGLSLMFVTKLEHGAFSLSRRREVLRQHDEILQCILDNDVVRVMQLGEEHMEDFCRTVASRLPDEFRRIVWWK